MVASSGVYATGMAVQDTRSPEQREVDQRRWQASQDQETREMTDTMMQESAPLLKLIGEKVTGVLRQREKDPEDKYQWADAPLIVRITTESGLVLRLEGTSHDYDGEDASIKAEAISE